MIKGSIQKGPPFYGLVRIGRRIRSGLVGDLRRTRIVFCVTSFRMKNIY